MGWSIYWRSVHSHNFLWPIRDSNASLALRRGLFFPVELICRLPTFNWRGHMREAVGYLLGVIT